MGQWCGEMPHVLHLCLEKSVIPNYQPFVIEWVCSFKWHNGEAACANSHHQSRVIEMWLVLYGEWAELMVQRTCKLLHVKFSIWPHISLSCLLNDQFCQKVILLLYVVLIIALNSYLPSVLNNWFTNMLHHQNFLPAAEFWIAVALGKASRQLHKNTPSSNTILPGSYLNTGEEPKKNTDLRGEELKKAGKVGQTTRHKRTEISGGAFSLRGPPNERPWRGEAIPSIQYVFL